MGYYRAGFDVVGVDIVPQPEYPFDFQLGDALGFLDDSRALLREFDAVHASPPCKRFTVAGAKARHDREHLFDPHPDLLTPTLDALEFLDIPWVVENVPGSPMIPNLILCGSMFGLQVRRHRWFRYDTGCGCGEPLERPRCRHAEQGPVVGVYGTGGADANRASRGGGGGVKVSGREAAEALGIDWTTYQPSLSQAIPPAYTEFIGRALLEHVRLQPADATVRLHPDTLAENAHALCQCRGLNDDRTG